MYCLRLIIFGENNYLNYFSFTFRKRKQRKVMFSQACVKNSVQGGVWQTPPRETRQTPPHPGDGHCSGRHASYWNAFLFSKRRQATSCLSVNKLMNIDVPTPFLQWTTSNNRSSKWISLTLEENICWTKTCCNLECHRFNQNWTELIKSWWYK